ncbi:MAG: tripartite tricarboxylate transporter substrate binding protein [Limnohabitans sp.]|nr:tripartite tricarboxylate transporter substrate binding protein [Limnohabitans sp.]
MLKFSFLKSRFIPIVLCGVAVLFNSTLNAQTYPTKPTRVIVNSAAGGLTDVLARLIGHKMGQSFVVDNKPGGGGLIGAELVSKAEADGYTIGIVASAITAAPAMINGSTFDASKDISHVVLLISTPLVMVTSINSPYQSVSQFVNEAKAKPGTFSIASGGNGTMRHLLAEQLQVHAGIKLVHVPYKGGGPALNDVLAGHVPVFFDTLNTSTKLIQDGKLRALAIASPKRNPTIPNVQGISWFAIIAPPNMPKDILNKLNEEANKALAAPDIKDRIVGLGGNVEGGPTTVLTDLIKSEIPRWTKLVKDRGITM